MKNIFLFSGQGSQFQGMVKDICQYSTNAKKVIDTISEIAETDIQSLLWETEATLLSRSDHSQLAITSASLAIMAALAEKGITASAVAGFSLGEFSALYASGILSLEDTVKVVKQRGIIMQNCCDQIAAESKGNPPGMAAVLKLEPETIIDLLQPYGKGALPSVFPANMNSPVQTVVSGTAEGLEIAEKLCKEAGAKRVVKLAVAGPFHSPLMEKAAVEFKTVLENITFNNPSIPIFSNVTGKIMNSGSEAKANAVLHLTHPVLWTSEEKEIAQRFENTDDNWRLIEVGPGATLCGLWRDSGINNGWTCAPSGKLTDIEAL
jgi:[acyl-carrier-protein] S-malonyltransferase